MEGAHAGPAKLWARLHQRFYWKRMHRSVEEFCRSCDICQKVKYDNFTKYGTL
ncbi:hypothetical protein GGF50DRAFT_27684, partial [Schizophyllum commune]